MSNDEIIIGGDSTDIPDGTFPAICVGWDTKHSEKFDNDFRTWEFQLDNGSRVGGASSLATSARSKGGQWIAALTGRKPAKGETVKVAGRPCLIVVSSERNGWPEVTDVLPPLNAPQPATDAPQGPAAPGVAPAATEADGGPVLDF